MITLKVHEEVIYWLLGVQIEAQKPWKGTYAKQLGSHYAEDHSYPTAVMHLALARWASGKRKGPPIKMGPYWKNRLRVMASWCSMEHTEPCYYRWLAGKLGI